MHPRICLLVWVSWALGCDGVVSSPPTHTPDAGPADPLFGSIVVSLRERTESRDAYSLVTGTLYDDVRPETELMRTVLEEGECKLREAVHPFCSDPCGSAAACVSDDHCVAYPSAQNIGPIVVTGLGSGADSTTLEPVAPTFFYQSDELPYPPCEESAQLTLESPTFAAEAHCVAPLIVDAEQPLRVRRDEPLNITWQPPQQPNLAKVRILLDISHHGGKRGDIWCDVPDTGSYEIPSSLVTALVDMGLAGFPSIILSRHTESPSTQPNVTFVVAATVERPVDTGIHSCLQDEDCPDTKTCDRQTVTCNQATRSVRLTLQPKRAQRNRSNNQHCTP